MRGAVASLGADCVEKELRDEHGPSSPRCSRRPGSPTPTRGEFRRYGSARRLYTFDVDNAGEY